jgi:hypothetical protein
MIRGAARAAPVLLAAAGVAQGAADETGEALRRFRALPVARQALVVRTIEQAVSADPDPTVQRVLALWLGFATLPDAAPAGWHDPAVWAPGAAPPRTLVRAGTPAHAAKREEFPPVVLLADLRKAVFYEWATGRVVRRAEPLSFEERFANLLAGYPPGSDCALAQVLRDLDHDPRERPVARIVEHRYADLDARVYEDITLYEAWYSGKTVHVPDVDAIPFAVQILKDGSFRSPIPADARREKLYARIRDRVHQFRLYRTLREAGAAAFLRAEPAIDPTYALLAPRFHWLFARHGDDARKVADVLRKQPRDELLDRLDATFKKSNEQLALRDARTRELRECARRIRELALATLAGG